MRQSGIPRTVMGALVLAFATALGARAQEGVPAGEAASDTAAAQPAYQFNLAPDKAAPNAQAEVILTPNPLGGYDAKLTAASLPEPASLKPDATTYVVWLYDPAAKKLERVAELPPEAGAAEASFKIDWPKFALVVTAEAAAAPEVWSGVAALTGQPAVPENPPPPGAEPAGGAGEQALAGGAGGPASAGAAGASDSVPAAGAPSAAGAAVPTGAVAQGPSPDGAGAPAAPAQPGGPAAPAAAAAAPPAGAPAGGVVAEPGPAAPGAPAAGQDQTGAVAVVSDAGEEALPPCPAPEEEEEDGKKKSRFKNSVLDRMRADAEGDTTAVQCVPVEGGGDVDSAVAKGDEEEEE